MAIVIVTGGAGFIGSHLVGHLLSQGHNVRVIDNLSTGNIDNLGPFINNIEFYKSDIRNYDSLPPILKGADYILHQAAISSVSRSVIDPLTSHENNATGTLNLLMAAKEATIKKLVFASSSSVYGNHPDPKNEKMPPQPISPYGVSKLSAELYCSNFYTLFSFPVIILRYFNVFGERQNGDSQYSAVIPKFIKSLSNNEQPVIYGDGNQTRDFTYIENVIHANMLALNSKDGIGGIFNIGGGKQTSVNELFAILKRLTKSGKNVLYSQGKSGDIRHSCANIDSAFNVLNYFPQINLEEGLKRTVDYWEANNL